MTAAEATSDRLLKAAGRRVGIETVGAQLIRDGANVMFLLPQGIVARIGRAGSEAAARREVWASNWLAQASVPVVCALAHVEQPVLVDGRPVTWWHLLPDHRAATPGELGGVLRQLHGLPIPAGDVLPKLDPFVALSIDRPVPFLTVGDVRWLQDRLATLREAFSTLTNGLPRCVVHGDAWQGNVAVAQDAQPILLDLETICIGMPEWDLISLAVDRTDFERITASEYEAFVQAYGGFDVIDRPGFRVLADIRELRWLRFVISKGLDNDRAAAESRHRLACLRGALPRPWTWSAF